MSLADAFLCEPVGYAANFLDRPSDERRYKIPGFVCWAGAAFARCRIAAIMAKASMTSETWRCHPCQERVSLWSRPSSFFAVSKRRDSRYRPGPSRDWVKVKNPRSPAMNRAKDAFG